jgi:hypothetical protein
MVSVIAQCSTQYGGVVDVINNCPHFDIKFPGSNDQLNIASGFREKSGADFDKVIGAIDGSFIWTLKPSKQECKDAVCGEKSYLCHRRDKFGLNMQAICDDKLHFIWIDISWLGGTADYMAWITSDLYGMIEKIECPLFPLITSKNLYIYVAIISSGLCSESHENLTLPLPPIVSPVPPSEKYLILNSFLIIQFQNAHNLK